MIKLACPVCLGVGRRACTFCRGYEAGLGEEIPYLLLPDLLRNSVYHSEMERYKRIAEQGPDEYQGYFSTKPEFRAHLLLEILKGFAVTEFINVGPGFGALEAITDDMERSVIDHCLGFLEYIKERWPRVRCIHAFAERLPFIAGSAPCLVADCVFQSVVDREAFLCEAARVVQPGGLFLFTVAYGWNYPRRPQNGFNVTRPDELAVLKRYLAELGFEMSLKYYNLGIEHEMECQATSNYLIVEAYRE